MKKKIKNVVVTMAMVGCLLPAANGLVEAANRTYVVQPGDSLWKIANQYNTSITTLRQLNNLWTNHLDVGQRLIVPGQAQQHYTVVWGDSLWKISQKTGVSVAAIQQANKLTSTYIEVGQRLVIPTTGSVTPPPTSPSTRPIVNLTQSEMDLLARLIHAEAKGEPYQGKVAVGAVVLNRIRSADFPNNLHDVVHQRFAFEPIATGYIWTITPDQSAHQAARDAVNGVDPTNGALYFFNPDKVTNPNNWIWTRQVTLRIGNHSFAI